MIPVIAAQRVQIESLRVEVFPDAAALGAAAAAAAAEEMRRLAAVENEFAVIFATGASQLETLRALTATAGLPWEKITGFHMDEYLGMGETHPASFRRYLRENLQQKVALKRFYEMDGTVADPEQLCETYAGLLRKHAPQLCLLGVGENGHLAFNDPDEADFNDPKDVKIVTLDEKCRTQQAGEGWFDSLSAVPKRAITVTMPALVRVPRLVLSVPGPRKAAIVRQVLLDEISTECPATILRQHPNATMYLDYESAAEIADLLR